MKSPVLVCIMVTLQHWICSAVAIVASTVAGAGPVVAARPVAVAQPVAVAGPVVAARPVAVAARPVVAASITECQELLRTGQYERCLVEATTAIADRSYGEEWPILKSECELATGRYADALATIQAGIQRYSWSVRLRMLEHEAAFANGKPTQAAEALMAIEKLVSSASWRYTDADDLVALGNAALALGADARDVQEGFFDRARRNFKNRPDGVIAAGRLANLKGDFELAGEILLPAVKEFATQPAVLFEASEALRSSDKDASVQLLQQVLEINPRYPAAMHRMAEQLIDAEDYAQATTTLEQVFSVNPASPEGHALQAVIHHLGNRRDAERASVERATQFSGPSAAVYHRIGRKLSDKYRFSEGAEYQRKALQVAPEFAPARIQLAQDLLRLGQETEGWQMAELAHQADGYNTTLFNLLQLKDSMQKYTTIETPHFLIRMDAREARVYGSQAEQLLEKAWDEMVERYGFEPEGPIIVDIFDRADDFAVRTFGIPDVAGFLGVCFGRVITANSPATRRETPSNWESILWHEFCHVITLQMTGNKIPRWLSEGISVYEERRQDSRWGQRMNATYRDRVLQDKDGVTPVGELSSAFLTAKDGADLNFAYYESSMVVEHIVNEFGIEALTAILQDLNRGLLINDALSRHTNGLEALEASFTEFLNAEASAFAPEADFESEGLAQLAGTDPDALHKYVQEHPDNFTASMLLASEFLRRDQLADAESLLKSLMALVPEDTSINGPRRMLAQVYQKLNQPTDEAAVLTEHLQRSADDLPAALRLQELSVQLKDDAQVVQLGRAVMAIDPFQTAAVVRMADSAELLGQTEAARTALTSLLQLQPDDAARLHYRLATQEINAQPENARRHVLLSLQEAPRYRDAHQLLLKIVRDTSAASEENPSPDTLPQDTPGQDSPLQDAADQDETGRKKIEQKTTGQTSADGKETSAASPPNNEAAKGTSGQSQP